MMLKMIVTMLKITRDSLKSETEQNLLPYHYLVTLNNAKLLPSEKV